MGAHPYFYFTPYQENIQRALDQLRAQEFKAGRYDPAMRTADPPRYMFEMKFPPDASWPSPGAKHASIEEAIDAGMEAGTGSILDLFRVTREPDFCSVCPLPNDDLVELFGTEQPNRALVEGVLTQPGRGSPVEAAMKGYELFWDRIERGQGRYIVVYASAERSELFFAGLSFD